jgi:hypothetical protein
VFTTTGRLNAKPMFITTLMLLAIGSPSSESTAYAIDIEFDIEEERRGARFYIVTMMITLTAVKYYVNTIS